MDTQSTQDQSKTTNPNHQPATRDDMIGALGDLIAITSTLQSVLVGEIEGTERERSLARFDEQIERAAQLRREVLGDPADTTADPDAPITDPKRLQNNAQEFRVAGQT